MCKKKSEKKYELFTTNPTEINEKHQKQLQGDWTLYKEREHVENLICQRFNFLIVVYSLFIAAFATINGVANKIIILSVGLIMITLLCLVLARTQEKLTIIMTMVHEIKDGPLPMIQKETKRRNRFPNINSLIIIGYVVPIFMMLTMLGGIILIATGVWNVDAAETITKCQCAAANVVM